MSIWADTIMFVFSLNNIESFNSIYTFYQEIDDYRTKKGLESIPSILIGIQGKSTSLSSLLYYSFCYLKDGSPARCVTHSEAVSLATNHMNASAYIEVTPETGANVESSFHEGINL